MRIIRKVILLIMLAFLLSGRQSLAQQIAKDSIMRISAIHQTHREYQHFISDAAPYYSGPQYVEYYLKIDVGQPFFLNTNFNLGLIRYDQILYENVPLKLDLVQNKIVIRDPLGVSSFSPSDDKIDYFTINGHEFFKLKKDSTNPTLPISGYYEVLYKSSRLTLLKKETKKVRDELNSERVPTRFIDSRINFYLKMGSAYTIINRKNQVLKIFKDRKTEMRQFIRKNNLDFKFDADNALLSILPYYESLTK